MSPDPAPTPTQQQGYVSPAYPPLSPPPPPGDMDDELSAIEKLPEHVREQLMRHYTGFLRWLNDSETRNLMAFAYRERHRARREALSLTINPDMRAISLATADVLDLIVTGRMFQAFYDDGTLQIMSAHGSEKEAERTAAALIHNADGGPDAPDRGKKGFSGI